MEIIKDVKVISSKGNSKILTNDIMITADKIVYNKSKFEIRAFDNVKVLSKNLKGEFIEIYGDRANYNMNTQNGKVLGDQICLKYFTEIFFPSFTLYTKNFFFDTKTKTFSVYGNVEILTSTIKIYSDNGIFTEKSHSMMFTKNVKKPVAIINYNNKSVYYEADKMFFYYAENQKRMVMSGSVYAKIEMV
ncbi:MAG: hypothetical protein LBQ07_01550 [Endomicrobium sp.]|nr:hypothetical protein [Endomicrobium sp.]